MTETFDIATQAPPASAGLSIAGSRVTQTAAGATGAKSATASNDPDDGNAHILALRPLVANAAPTVNLTSPANGATFTAPASITLSATAADTDGAVVQVEFFDGATLVGTVPTTTGSTSYSVTLNNVAAGAHLYTARATDNQGASATSAPVNITVNTATALQMYFIQTDHLKTPRMIADQAGITVWKWDNIEPFGNSLPNDDPDGDGVAFVFDLRFPGQYFDRETNHNYNMRRDYDLSIGRYIESDPIGLVAGLNTYVYVNSAPLRWIDPTGLDRYDICKQFGMVLGFLCGRCVDFACYFAPIYCCDVEKKQCQANAGGAEDLIQCEAKWTECIVRAVRRAPREPRPGDI